VDYLCSTEYVFMVKEMIPVYDICNIDQKSQQDLLNPLKKTAGDLICERILLEAKRLLTNADATIAEIAYELTSRIIPTSTGFLKKALD
jgi:hypothetical protein